MRRNTEKKNPLSRSLAQFVNNLGGIKISRPLLLSTGLHGRVYGGKSSEILGYFKVAGVKHVTDTSTEGVYKTTLIDLHLPLIYFEG